MRFLLCGIGSIGQRHYKNLRALGHEAAFVRSGKNAGYNTEFVEKFLKEQEKGGNTVRQFDDLNTAIAEFHPDGVFVVNPNARHVDTALAAARAGLHLFIEKPVATSFQGLDELEKLVAQKKLTVIVGYNFRFHPLLKKMKELLVGGVIGSVLSAQVEMGENIEDWHPWEDYAASYGPWKEKGGGAVLCFSHDVDYLYWFLGKPQKIVSVGGKITPLKGDAEDMVKSLWTYANGSIASIHLDYWQRPRRRNFHIVGSEGALLWDYEAKTLIHSPRAKDAKPTTYSDPAGFDRNDMFVDEVKDFIDAIQKKRPTAVTLEQGVEVLHICQEILRQVRS